MDKKEILPSEFRSALGQFPTGVTIVTAVDKNGEKVGITANSFSSVSLAPPLILWSIDKDARCYGAFNESNYFAVHILTSGQDEISTRFAKKEGDKFADLVCEKGINELPLLPEFAACFQCEVAQRYDGGDHTILVGEVVDFENRGHEPLLFFRGKYGAIA